MDRRFLMVLVMSVMLALVVAIVFYKVAANSAARRAPTDVRDVVVAAEALPLGLLVKPNHIKVIKVPVELAPKSGFSKVDDVLERSVVSNIMADEALVEGRLAPRGSGFGLSPIIPSGMRAVAVRVNEIIGVAGFVLPGMRVDILVTGRPSTGSADTMTTTVLQNITVLSANQQMQPDQRGQAINATVVNLLVTPDQAETITLAASEGRIQLVLRNAVDNKVEKTTGRQTSELYNQRRAPVPAAAPRPRPQPVKVAAAPPPPPPPPAPVVVPDEVIMIRGPLKTVEPVGMKK
ncbi:MAG: Flp pilus assembly protein CpaB [Bryobacteraceae bacterium]